MDSPSPPLLNLWTSVSIGFAYPPASDKNKASTSSCFRKLQRRQRRKYKREWREQHGQRDRRRPAGLYDGAEDEVDHHGFPRLGSGEARHFTYSVLAILL
ncbi:unnamed protein product [Haemonchus placei]|uniref:Uncharacterized protein n=1 Tax=Haemonchus placei TaxID=6290 RepID=A0A3P7ZHJ4_HAEPC|nr:unnamed protein product [Haemonchus placei]